MDAKFEWAAFELELFDELRLALAAVGDKHRGERFYAVALHGVERELDGLLSLPLLAAATEAGSAPPDGEGFWGPRYNPEDWRLPEIVLREGPALRLERALTAEATRGSQAQWRRVEARYSRVLVRLARRLRDEAPKVLPVAEHFIAFWHDEEGGPDLAARTIPRRLFTRLFPRQMDDARARQGVSELPDAERAAFLVSRFGCFEGITTEEAQHQLLELGPAAVGPLAAALSHPQHGWTAAKVLGQIGVATPEIIAKLREGADNLWHAMALGMLGDHGWLAKQGGSVAAHGLCAPLKAITAGGPPLPLGYGPLEAYLERADDAAREMVAEELKPGTTFVPIAKSDVPEALRGLGSPHAVVRWHAAALLGDRSLGATQGKRILPALSERLTDDNPIVRRIAVLSISYWKAAGRPFRGAIEGLRQDPDEAVRHIVEHALSR